MNRFFLQYLLLVLIIFVASCRKDSTEDIVFKSNFNSSEARTFIGPEYWSNPLQDWQIENGELICLVSKPNRNVHVLTKKIDTVAGNLKMSVQLKALNLKDEDNKNWIGFSIGSKGEFNDYRDNAIFGKGLNLGVTTNGNLFIDKIKDNQVKKDIQNILSNGARLNVNLVFEKDTYILQLSLYKSDSDDAISQIELIGVDSNKLNGNLVLVSDYKGKRKADETNKASVSFKNWKILGSKVKTNNEYKFGPILFSQYTLSKNTLKLTVQMAPVIIKEEKVKLQIKKAVNWKTIRESAIDNDARTSTFKIENWDTTIDKQYRLVYDLDRGEEPKETFYWEGIIRKDPIEKDEIVIAGFTGNDQQGFPNTDIFEQVKYHDPDVLFFSGDQIYEPNGGFGVQRSPIDKAMLDYLRKWYMYGWAYRDLLKDRPTVAITDDHDVYHGNIWGAGGIATPTDYGQGAKAQDAGGYKMPPEWVNMVQRTQTSHLPDPFDPTPVAQNIGTYYTDMVYGDISFAILEDRKFKSAPKGLLPKAEIQNGWAQNKSFNMKKDGDVSGAKLLGDRQLLFLDKWSTDWSYRAEMKVLLSQTIFANVATLPKEAMSGAIIPTLRIMKEGDYPPDDRPVSDLDSNGWPQTGRNKAVETVRKGFAFHLAGDQHLGSTIQYGVDNWSDSGFAFCVPSITNHWPRRWYPAEGGKNRKPDMPKYTGQIEDGFGNKMTVYAVSNPLFTGLKPERIYDRAAGYGIVRLNKKERKITLECWPRQAKPQNGEVEQYPGWPISITQEQNFGKKAVAFLPEIKINGLKNPVVKIINESNNKTVYSLRIKGSSYTPKIFDKSTKYTIKIGEPDTNSWQTKMNVSPGNNPINFNFNK
ncbi:alkaline phosphatase D family protein [Aureibaculum conchae]|uniref:alkaline phosphatase D family protein n=1 Tax=Aureibaculum sp. 2308TA14-22 TaxID=3108392 RepID=UPI0033978429